MQAKNSSKTDVRLGEVILFHMSNSKNQNPENSMSPTPIPPHSDFENQESFFTILKGLIFQRSVKGSLPPYLKPTEDREYFHIYMRSIPE